MLHQLNIVTRILNLLTLQKPGNYVWCPTKQEGKEVRTQKFLSIFVVCNSLLTAPIYRKTYVISKELKEL